MEILLGCIALGIIIYLVATRMGNFGFWKKVQSYPELSYVFFLGSECWRVEDGINDFTQPSRLVGEWHGPFYVRVPSLGVIIKVYGKVGCYEQSKKDLRVLIDVGR